MNIPVPNNAKTISGTKLKDGNDQIASKNFTPKAYRIIAIITKNTH